MLGNPHLSAQYVKVLVRDFYLKPIDQYLSHLSFVKLWNLLLKIISFITYLLNLYYHPFNMVFFLKRSNLSASLSTSFDRLNSFKNHCHTYSVFFDLSKALHSILFLLGSFYKYSRFTLFIPYVLMG